MIAFSNKSFSIAILCSVAPSEQLENGFLYNFVYTQNSKHFSNCSHKKKMDPMVICANLVAYSCNVCYKHAIFFSANNGMSQNFTKYCIMTFSVHIFFGVFCVSFLSATEIPFEHIRTMQISVTTDNYNEKTKFIKKKICFSCRIHNIYVKKATTRKGEKISLFHVTEYIKFEAKWKDKEKCMWSSMKSN